MQLNSIKKKYIINLGLPKLPMASGSIIACCLSPIVMVTCGFSRVLGLIIWSTFLSVTATKVAPPKISYEEYINKKIQ